MKKSYLFPLLLVLLVVSTQIGLGFDGQDPAETSAAKMFPSKLLEGMPDFDFAVLLQGDLRGNVGPCG